jgi:dTDP-4-amino-4,6-dideoxygalactose transaminase
MSIKVPFLDLPKQHIAIEEEIHIAMSKVIRSSNFCSGPAVATFEKQFARFVGTRYCIAVNSGTSALHLALLAAGIGEGDEVIAPAMTFMATVAAIQYTGATPKLVDIEADSFCLSPKSIEQAITDKTRAIIPVHLYGLPARMSEILAIAEKNDILVIEDAAQAHGAKIGGENCGNLGDLATFSFYPGKNLGACGEGGAVTTDNEDFARLIRSMRDWGQEGKGNHINPGFNYRMDGLQGAALSVKLQYLDKWTKERQRAAARYRELLTEESIELQIERKEANHVYHIFAILTKERDQISEALQANDISYGIHYPTPIHLQPSFSSLGYSQGDFPMAECIANEELSLPIYPEITDEQIAHVVKHLKKALND